MLDVVLVEDEIHGRETLKNLLMEYCCDIEIIGMGASVGEGIDLINRCKPDLVFLDIELHSGMGFEILEAVDVLNFEVVFTTAYENYAVKAIKFSAIDYLLKPIDISELQDAVKKVKLRREAISQNQKLLNLLKNLRYGNDHLKTLTLATSEGLEFIAVSDIIKLEANGSYTMFYLKNNRKLLVSKNLKEYEKLLPDAIFYRAHHSCIINLSQVERYVKTDGGYIVMREGLQAIISQKRKERFIELMNNRHMS